MKQDKRRRIINNRRMHGPKIAIWIYVSVFVTFMLPHQAWTPTATNFQHEYEIGAPPGQLYTERNSFEFMATLTIALVWLVPLSAAMMTSFYGNRVIENVHLIVVVFLFFWFSAILGDNIINWINANPDPYDVSVVADRNNPATDRRWCCIYGNFGPPCHLNTLNMTCVPFVLPEMLGIDPTFAFSFVMNCVLVILLLFDFIWVLCAYIPQSRKFKPSAMRSSIKYIYK